MKKKLSLKELNVKSFVTAEEKNTRGGFETMFCSNNCTFDPVGCEFSWQENCTYYGVCIPSNIC